MLPGGTRMLRAMEVHAVDGTYELFRHFYGVPPRTNARGEQIGAVAGVVGSIVGMIEGGATHIGVATDQVIESFRNELYAGYKTGEGIDPDLFAQFPLLEDALQALGVAVWAMVEYEADDALAAAAAIADADPRVDRVLICTPDKDLAQCVVGDRVVQLDRRKREVRNEEGVVAKFGVRPISIPDLLALIGDSADGFPGLPGWGPKSAATVLACYGAIEAIPDDPDSWEVTVRGAGRLGNVLREGRADALLFKDLATLRTEIDVGTVDDWAYRGPTPAIDGWLERLGDDELTARIRALG